MLEELLATGNNSGDSPVGQMTWTTAGVYEWVVPEGVTSVCCVVVGAGQSGASKRFGTAVHGTGGRGGNLRYRNNIPVEPGQTYRIEVGSGGFNRSSTVDLNATGGEPSKAFDLVAGYWGSGLDSKHPGFDGGVGRGNNYTSAVPGGGAGTFAARGGTGTGAGVDIVTGNITPSTGYEGRNSGGGGYGIGNPDRNSSRRIYRGGDGAVRIIWGPNRAFPNLNIRNM